MSFKTLAYTTWLLHTTKIGLKFELKIFSLNCSTSANLEKKGPHIDEHVNLQVWGEFKMLRTKIASKLEKFFNSLHHILGVLLKKSSFHFFECYPLQIMFFSGPYANLI
jgi:hypothetical protein